MTQVNEAIDKHIDGVIFDIKKYAIHDGPGIRTTVFFKGCPLQCAWCHNPESWSQEPELMFRANRCIRCGRCIQSCPHETVQWVDTWPVTDLSRCRRCGACIPYCPPQARGIAGYLVTAEDVMAQVAKDAVFYDESGGGVTFSGGEPLMQPEFLAELLQLANERDIHTAVDTCGYAPLEIVEKIAARADLFLCDIKHMDAAKHEQFTGVDNRRILENIAFLADSGCAVIIRIPVVPGFNETKEDIAAITNFVKSLKTIQQIDLLPYNIGGLHKAERLGRPGRIRDFKEPNSGIMGELADTVRRAGFNVNIGG